MSLGGLQALVRAQIARTKDAVTLRAGGAQDGRAPSAAAAVTSAVAAVAPATPVRTLLVAPGHPANETINAQLATRGELPARVVAVLGGSRYLVDIDGEQRAIVLEGAAISEYRPLLPGAEVRLVAGRGSPSERALATPIAATTPGFSPLARLVAAASRDESGQVRNPMDPARMPESGAPAVPTPPATRAGDLPHDGNHLARSLKDTVDASGLFYESHVAAWAEGRRSLESVQSEPQARIAADALRAPSPAGTVAAPAAAAGELRAIVREQLQALNAQQVAWRGELWPGQPAEIAIGRDPYAATDPREQPWRARLALTLPSLGRVEVDLTLLGNDLGLAVGAADGSRGRLANAAPELVLQLGARGLAAHPRFTPLAPEDTR